MTILKFYFICFLLLLGFNTNSKNGEIKFPIEKSISPSAIKVPPVIYAKTPGVVITGNYMVVMRSFSDPLYSVFEIPDCNYLGDFGTLGKGPKEFEVPDARTASATEKGFRIFDTRKGLLLIDITNFSINKSFEIEQIRLPGELYILNDPVQINDSIIYGMPYVAKSEKLFVKYNIQSSEVDYFGTYPSFCPKESKDNYWAMLWRHSVIKPDGTKFASFFARMKMFLIYNNSEVLEKEVLINIPENIFDPKRRRGNIMTFYKEVKATNEYIYALCLNEPESKTSLEIWDWQGNPVAKLNLDNQIFSFDITNDNKRLYCIDQIIIDKIFVYEIDSILKLATKK